MLLKNMQSFFFLFFFLKDLSKDLLIEVSKWYKSYDLIAYNDSILC